MTLREALDLLELNERTLEQSMLESSLQNRLEHTELRHVLRVFEAYRKVNAFLNPSFNTQGDARMTIIDESVPGGPMLEVTRASYPTATASSIVTLKERDTFSDTMVETWAASDVVLPESKTTLALEAIAPRVAGVNVFMMLGLTAVAFSVGLMVLGPTMSLIFKRPVASVSSLQPVVTAPPVAATVTRVAPVITAPPVAFIAALPASVTQPAPPPVAVAVKPVALTTPVKPVTLAITKPTARPTVTSKPPVVEVKPRVTPQTRIANPRITPRPRVTVQPRVAARRIIQTPRAASRSVSIAAPSRRTVNQRQFAQWDSAGVVLRYRSWTLIPDAVRGLPANAFRTAIFVARNPASLPDIRR